MQLRPETVQFLSDLETFANRKLSFSREIGILLDLARSRDAMQVYEDIVFFAKFLAKSFDLMKRIGPDGEGYDKVSAEFQSTMEKASTLVKTLIKESPPDVKAMFLDRFFTLDQNGLASFMQFLRELAWVKNWTVDGKALP